jgi:hypothetical protein
MATTSNVRTSAGSTLGVSASAPATYTGAGFLALTFADVGEITDLGEFGREYTKVEHKPVGSRRVVKRKGGFDEGSTTIPMGRSLGNAGQTLMKAALLSDDSYSFCETLQDGTKFYYSAQCMSLKTKVGSVDDITALTAVLEIDNEIIEVEPEDEEG